MLDQTKLVEHLGHQTRKVGKAVKVIAGLVLFFTFMQYVSLDWIQKEFLHLTELT